jgi:hypothetical protein
LSHSTRRLFLKSDLSQHSADVSAAVLTAKPVVQVPVRRVKHSHLVSPLVVD